MCRICYGIGPICGWQSAKSKEDYFAGWEKLAILRTDDWEDDLWVKELILEAEEEAAERARNACPQAALAVAGKLSSIEPVA